MIKHVGFQFKCDSCGWTNPMQYSKKLPDGWKRIKGEDICNRCLRPKLTEKKFHQKYPPIDPGFGATNGE